MGGGLDELAELIGPRFSSSEPRRNALAHVQGLLSERERKNSWTLSEQAGQRVPDPMQRLLSAADWDPDLVRDDLQKEYRADALIAALPATAWRVGSAGAGSKGDRRYAWARALTKGERDSDAEYWLLARRSLSGPDALACYLCHAPKRVSLAELARVASARWAIEESFQTAKGQTGLDHYRVRQDTGWYRHATLSMLAHAFLTVTRSKRGLPAPMASSSR